MARGQVVGAAARVFSSFVASLPASAAWAAVPSDAPHLDGASLSLLWCLPFAGLLLSIAILPMAAPHFWHHHYGKVSIGWATALLVPVAMVFGLDVAAYHFLHTVLLDYVPFVAVLLALYLASSGVTISGRFNGTPAGNTVLLAGGTLIASWIGTTGACVLLIQPLLRANRGRKRNVHVFVFFIFLVGNIGGVLTPLGDPPLFLGYLQGVDFFWFTTRLLAPMLMMAVPLLAVFFALDSYFARKDGLPVAAQALAGFKIRGRRNLVLLIAIVGVVLAAGSSASGIAFTLYYVTIRLEDAARTAMLIALAAVSWGITHGELRGANDFSWAPIAEVAKLFIGIFLTMVPALAIIAAGTQGASAPLIARLAPNGEPDPAMYFWVTGVLSSLLDNAPTFLIFFKLAGGDAEAMMGPLAPTLIAISAGAVFMGANTYIGNAPNFLVKSICETAGVRMPSFFGYVVWSMVFLTPLYVLVTILFM